MKLSCRDYPGGGDAGAPLVLLHGLFGSAAQWHHIAAPLSARRLTPCRSDLGR